MLKLATVAARRLAARHHRCMRQLSSKEFDFTVDRTGLGKVGYESSPSAVQAPETPLGLELGSQILARGPLSVYEYMRQCLLHPRHGYYARSGAERNFGAGGDFVTGAELSQLFGELVRGLRRTLGARPATHAQKPDAETPVTWALDGFGDFGTRATWHAVADEIDDDGVATLLVGQEVLDAFPAYQFVKTDNGWREKLGEWLQRMGIVPRLEALLNLDDITESQVEDLISACERLLDPEQMGERRKSSRSSTLAHRSRPRASYPATASRAAADLTRTRFFRGGFVSFSARERRVAAAAVAGDGDEGAAAAREPRGVERAPRVARSARASSSETSSAAPPAAPAGRRERAEQRRDVAAARADVEHAGAGDVLEGREERARAGSATSADTVVHPK
ncbi:protein-arginine omega-N symmetric methyltransferase [Aureococcus anophagefferens]|uniref:Protein arginine methyltransferase NDUFAF7 n=1 Tax=Aureococcus anophagefferens TaxID=44056 RepID=A0ABR1G4C4_AURAN